jgi:hypothetical protein
MFGDEFQELANLVVIRVARKKDVESMKKAGEVAAMTLQLCRTFIAAADGEKNGSTVVLECDRLTKNWQDSNSKDRGKKRPQAAICSLNVGLQFLVMIRYRKLQCSIFKMT